MKPAFALTLSHDGIRLLHRTARGWMLVGDADLEDAHLEDTLRFLRKTAAGLSPQGIATKLVLPNSQILYTTVSAPGPDAASRRRQIATALAGRTPYPVEDLAFDWSMDAGGLARVAAVTRLTLDEAESFAEDHGFNPVCFVSIPDAGAFDGEPFFGLTSKSGSYIPQGAALERETEVLRVVGRVDLPKGPIAAAPDEAMATAPLTANPVGLPPLPDTGDAVADAPDTPPEVPTEAVPARQADMTHGSTTSVTDSGIQEGSIPVPAPDAAPPADDAAEAPMAAMVPGPEDDPETPRVDTPDVIAGFSSRRKSDAAAAVPGPVPGAVPGTVPGTALPDASGFVPTGAAPSAGTAPRLGGAVWDKAVTAPKLPIAPAIAEPGSDGALRRAPAKKGKPGLARPESPKVALHSSASDSAPPPPLRRKVKSTDEVTEELTVFGARRSSPTVGGKPRYMGVALFAGLLLFMAIVAFAASWLGGSDATGSVASTGPATALTPAEVTTGADSPQTAPPAPQTAIVTPAPDATGTPPASPDTPSPDTAPTAAQATDAPGSVNPTVDDPTVDATNGAPRATASVPTPATTPADGAASAAFGAQSLPDTTEPQAITATEAAPVAEDAGPLPSSATLLHDTPLSAQPLPLPFGALVRYGPDGLILATPEGVLTPGGFTLYAGKPARPPLPRPDTIAALAAAAAAVPVPVPAPDATAAGTSGSAAPAVAAPPDPRVLGKRPQSRPATLIVPQDQGALTPTPQTPGAVAPVVNVPVLPAHAALKPQVRPATILAAAKAATPVPAAIPATDTATNTAADTSTGTRYAVATSRRPATRPSDFSKAVESALAVAVAEAVPAPAPQPDPLPDPQPAAAPAPTATAPTTTVEIDEPEPTAAAPSIPTRASVAKQATAVNAIDLGKINLIGIYGSAANRRALIRTGTGRFVRVQVGDRFDGGQIAAIGDAQVTYVKNGRTVVLKMVKTG